MPVSILLVRPSILDEQLAMMRSHFRREAIWMVLLPAFLVVIALLAALLLPRLVSGRTGQMDLSDSFILLGSNPTSSPNSRDEPIRWNEGLRRPAAGDPER